MRIWYDLEKNDFISKSWDKMLPQKVKEYKDTLFQKRIEISMINH
jgi:hypothetical protein